MNYLFLSKPTQTRETSSPIGTHLQIQRETSHVMTVIFQDTLAKGVIVIFHAKLDSKYKFVNIIFSYSPKRKQFIWHAKEVNEFVKNQFREGILRPRFQKKKDGESRDHNTHSRVMWNGLVCSTSGHPEVKKSTISQRAYIITRNVRTAGGMHSTQN